MARVLVIGDTHCPAMHPRYPEWLQEIHSQWQCERVVHIGDLVDNCALSFHKKHSSLKNAISEKEKAMEQIAQLTAAFPKADWMIGNHDVLPWRWADEVGIPHDYLRKPSQIWKCRWKYHARFSDITIDGVIYRHGDKGKGGRMAAFSNANAEHCSLVQGHLHQQGGVEMSRTSKLRLFGVQTGSGVNDRSLHFEYGRKFNSKSVLGCAVVIDGHTAYFEPMPEKLAKDLS
jgi:predicted phosphodiesterase